VNFKSGCLKIESGIARDASTPTIVIRGLDPRIHRTS
jgi:hypothetical protein